MLLTRHAPPPGSTKPPPVHVLALVTAVEWQQRGGERGNQRPTERVATMHVSLLIDDPGAKLPAVPEVVS